MEAVIFDMDGVIVDTEKFYFSSKGDVLKKYGINVPHDYHKAFMGTTFEYMWGKMKEEFQLSASIPELIEQQEVLRKKMIREEGYTLLPQVDSLIQELHENGIPLAVASSSPLEEIQNVLDSVNLRGCFDVVVSSEEVARSKPFPDVFLEAAKRLNVDICRSFVFEDSGNGVKAALSSGAFCIHVNPPLYTIPSIEGVVKEITTFNEINFETLQELSSQLPCKG